MNRLRHRPKIMKIHAQRLLTDSHFISMLKYSRQTAAAALENWLAEQVRCLCRPNCPGKHVGAVLPENCSPEAWTNRTARLFCAERSA